MGALSKKPLAVTSGSKSACEARFKFEIIAHNEELFFIPVNGKRPYQLGWQKTPKSFSDAVLEVARGDATGIGLLHAHSGTCSLDIDQLDQSIELLADHDIDLVALLEDPVMFRIHSPKVNSEKLVFRTPDGQPRSTTQFKDADGAMVLEIRCEGAQDVWVGSDYQYTSGGRYEHSGSDVIPQLPKELVALWGAEAAKKPTFIAQEGEGDVYEDDETLAIAKARLLKAKAAVANQGGNNQTYRVVQEMRDLGLSLETAYKLMLDKFNPRCEPPWGNQELARIVRSAYKHAKNPQGCGNTIAAFAKAGIGGEGRALYPDTSEAIGIYDGANTSNTKDLSHSDLAIDLGCQFFYENTRYVARFGAWFIWDGTRWVQDEKLCHLDHIGKYLRTRADELLTWAEGQKGELSNAEYEKLLRTVKQEVKTLKSAPLRMQVESIIRTDPKCTISPSDLDTDLRIIGTPNEAINLATGELSQPRRKDLITKSTGCELKAGTPTEWLNFLAVIFDGDQDMINFIQRLLGYTLTGLTVEEKLFFFYGTGANGKSKLLETIYFVLGDYAKRAPASLLLEQRNAQHPTAMAGLMGARGVFASEIPSGKTWDDQVIKDATGGDTITARLMRQDFFEFMPHFKLLIAGNHQPRLKNVDESVVRRMVMIPFNVTISPEQRDTQLGEKLKAEAGQILSWCVKGSVQYFERGLDIPESVTSASKEYIQNEDVIGEFVDTCMEEFSGQIEVHVVFEIYTNWIRSQGYSYPKTERQLRKEFKDRGYTIKRSNSVYYIHNMRVKF